MDDSAGAVSESPGFTAGAEVPAVPGLPELSLGLEGTVFGVRSPPGIAWYQHGGFHEGWTVDRRLLGHPLGGHGRELLVTARLDLLEARLRLEGRGFLRERREENLFAPERVGGSVGATLNGAYRASGDFELVLSAEVEHGERDWTRSALMAGLRWMY